MTTRQKYIIPETIEVPYQNPLMEIGGSTGADEYIDDGELNVFAKEYDEDYEADLWANERQGFGLQEWNEEE